MNTVTLSKNIYAILGSAQCLMLLAYIAGFASTGVAILPAALYGGYAMIKSAR